MVTLYLGSKPQTVLVLQPDDTIQIVPQGKTIGGGVSRQLEKCMAIKMVGWDHVEKGPFSRSRAREW